jgi:hypothetical protein
MKNKISLILLLLVVSIGTQRIFAQSKELEDILGVGKTELEDSKPETKKLYGDLITALEQGDFANGKTFAQNYVDVIDYTEPYQKNFAKTALDLLNTAVVSDDPTVSKAEDAAKAAVAEIHQQIAGYEKQMHELENKRAQLQKDMADANTSGALVGALLGPQLGQVANANTQNAANDMNINERNIELTKQNIRELEQKIPSVEARGRSNVEAMRNQSQSLYNDQRGKVYVLVRELIAGNNYREAIALSNTALKKLGQDTELVNLSQSAINQQKIQKRAYAIAQAASKDANDLIATNHLWEAKVELERSFAQINDRVKDSDLLKATVIETAKITRDLSRKIATAQKAHDVIMSSGERDAATAEKKYAEYITAHPDYPEIDSDKLKLSDLRTAQIEAKFAKRIAAIQEVIGNDPAEARAMIKRLMTDNTDPDEVSVLKSKITKLEKSILDVEIARISAKIDEAQSYLTKWDVSFAEAVKVGGHPAVGYGVAFKGSVENLTRAISVQEGVVKQIEILMTEPMTTMSKSQLVGLQTTAQGALDIMRGAQDQAATNKKMVNILIGAVVVAILGVVVFFITKKKKSSTTPVA